MWRKTSIEKRKTSMDSFERPANVPQIIHVVFFRQSCRPIVPELGTFLFREQFYQWRKTSIDKRKTSMTTFSKSCYSGIIIIQSFMISSEFAFWPEVAVPGRSDTFHNQSSFEEMGKFAAGSVAKSKSKH
ncbi:MAG TPA: hypothetical protein VGJ73_07435 [Verrucomicrobiae bacterium]